MNLPENICDNYAEHPEAGAWIEKPGTDPDSSFHEFQRDYRAWEAIGAPEDLVSMVTVFGAPDDAERALLAGDGRKEGRVRKTHCGAFSAFSGAFRKGDAAVQAMLREKGIAAAGGPDPLDRAFRDVLIAYVHGAEPTDHMRALLNGALFARQRYEPTGLSGATKEAGDDFFAVPGHLMWKRFRRSMEDEGWALIARRLDEAAAAMGADLINLDLAAMLRLGTGQTLFPPQSPGSGIVIFGAG